MQRFNATLRRTKRLIGEEEFRTEGYLLPTDMASKSNEERGCSAEDQGLQLVKRIRLGDSCTRETCVWGTTPTCCCEIQREITDTEVGRIRLYLPKTWELPVLKIDEGQCPICDKVWGIRKYRCRSFVTVETDEEQSRGYSFWYDNEWEDAGRDNADRTGILPSEQEEDRGLTELVCEEDIPTDFEMDDFIRGLAESGQREDCQVVEHEPISRETIRLEGPLHPWFDHAWEDELNKQIANVLPYVPDPSH